MKITNPTNVHFLALEGGGGKGVAYLGAIRALESKGVLPIRLDRRGKNQIKGLSGASAGAITSLLLAMGATSQQIAEILSHSKTFDDFFDGPDPGLIRAVDQKNKPVTLRECPKEMSKQDFVDRGLAPIAPVLKVRDVIASLVDLFFSPTDRTVRKVFLDYPDYYLYNLIYDRGIFPGVAPRRFLAGVVSKFLETKIQQGVARREFPEGTTGKDLNFDQFEQITGVELVITGANVTKHRPMVFSKRHTPLFPVAEAVGISMNLPILFKPVKVEALVAPSALVDKAEDYQGFWVDGGLLNNFPLHAFDHHSPQISSRFPDLRPLNPHILGLRLTDGPPDYQKKGKEAPSTGFAALLAPLKEHVGNIFETLMFPSEGGQIRTIEEIEQTIDLFTYDLETTEFAPPPKKSEKPKQEAERAVIQYFRSKGFHPPKRGEARQ